MPDAERDLVSGVIQLANLLTRRLAPLFQRAKVTPQQWSILAALGESETSMTLAGLAIRKGDNAQRPGIAASAGVSVGLPTGGVPAGAPGAGKAFCPGGGRPGG